MSISDVHFPIPYILSFCPSPGAPMPTQGCPTHLKCIFSLLWHHLPLSPNLPGRASNIHCPTSMPPPDAPGSCRLTLLLPTLLWLLGWFWNSSRTVATKQCSCSLSLLAFLQHENTVVIPFGSSPLPWLQWRRTLLALWLAPAHPCL